MLDGYCRHMGGDLTQGTVKGDEIACPFHDWRWGGDGKCKAIPYARRVPLRARTQSTTTAIRNGQLLIWHDVEGSEPDHDILPPELPGHRTPASTPTGPGRSSPIDGSHCRELDRQRRGHGALLLRALRVPDQLPQRLRGPQATQFMESNGPARHGGEGYGDADLFLKSEATYYGPSYMINWLEIDYKGFETEVILINCHIPTGADSFTLQYGITVQEARGPRRQDRPSTSPRSTPQMFGDGFLQDVHIWKNKVPVQNPLLCEEDGPVYQLRRWYEQFYVDEADVAPEMTERFEFEVDTTKANEYWQEEVAENLAKKAAEDADGAEATPTATGGV